MQGSLISAKMIPLIVLHIWYSILMQQNSGLKSKLSMYWHKDLLN